MKLDMNMRIATLVALLRNISSLYKIRNDKHCRESLKNSIKAYRQIFEYES